MTYDLSEQKESDVSDVVRGSGPIVIIPNMYHSDPDCNISVLIMDALKDTRELSSRAASNKVKYQKMSGTISCSCRPTRDMHTTQTSTFTA
jgi:hypothetical protein